MTFSDRAKPLKTKSRMTLNEIATACNISESMASRYINGSVVPPEDIARKMLEILEAAASKGGEKEEEQTDMRAALAMIREIYEGRIDDLWKSNTDLKEQILREKREKWVFFILLAVTVTFIFALFYVDLSYGDLGWFRY